MASDGGRRLVGRLVARRRTHTFKTDTNRTPLEVEASWNVMAHGDAQGGEVKGKLANIVGSQYPSHYLGTWCIQHYHR